MAKYFPDLLAEYKLLQDEMKKRGMKSGDMYREVKEAIFWMETGYDPAEVRAATRVDSVPVDPHHMQMYITYANSKEDVLDSLIKLQEYISNECEQTYYLMELERAERNKDKINSAMQGLTPDEKAVFIAIEAERLPFSRVANMLGVTKSTVQTWYMRARRKIRENVTNGTQECLF